MSTVNEAPKMSHIDTATTSIDAVCAKHLGYNYPFQSEPALYDLSFSLRRGEAMLITGPSGCGKTTLLRILNGLIPNHFKGTVTGELTVAGMTYPTPLAEVSEHVGTVLQNPDEQFMATTIEEEVALALEWQCVSHDVMHQRVGEALRILNLSDIATRSVFNLSQGEKQKCIIASVIAASADIVVMDEPTANLSPDATVSLAEICLALKQRGVTLVIVDHRLYWLRGILDKLLVLSEGRQVYYADRTDGIDPLDRLNGCGALAQWGLRRTDVKRLSFPACSEAQAFAIDVTGLTFTYPRGDTIFNNFSTHIPSGAVTAIVGENGAGKTTFARLLCGLNKVKTGAILFKGEKLTPKVNRMRTAFVMQQMEVQLYMRTVCEELTHSATHKSADDDRDARVAHWMDVFQIAHLAQRHPHSLSGGEKQRLVIACALMKQPELLILDEPTSGLDGRNMHIIADQLKAFSQAGGAILLITHDLELLELIADYQLVIEGKHK